MEQHIISGYQLLTQMMFGHHILQVLEDRLLLQHQFLNIQLHGMQQQIVELVVELLVHLMREVLIQLQLHQEVVLL